MNEMSGEIVKEFLAVMKERAAEEKKVPEESAEQRDVSPKEETQISKREQHEEKEPDAGLTEKRQIGERTREGGGKAPDALQDGRNSGKAENAGAERRREESEQAAAGGLPPKAAEPTAAGSKRAAHISADETEPAKETVRTAENVKTGEGVWDASEDRAEISTAKGVWGTSGGGDGIPTAPEGIHTAAVNVNITIDGMTVREEADIERIAGQLASRIEQAACLF